MFKISLPDLFSYILGSFAAAAPAYAWDGGEGDAADA